MASKLLSERTKTILYWAAIIILFALFIGFLVAYIKKEDASNDVAPSEPPPPTTTPLPSEEEIRLDSNVIPNHVQLDVTSDQDNDQFSGKVSIDFTAKESTRQVKLHCKSLNISKYTLTDANSAEVAIAKLDENPYLELCTFELTKDIAPGKYSISIEYSGKFKDGQIVGFYKSSYLDNQGNKKYLTAAKFEPTYARWAFPAFDEPRFKPTWDISVVHQSSLVALSNEDVVKTEAISGKDGWSRTTFKQTVPMSSYLVCFIVSDFKYTETRTTNGLRVRVYSRPDEVDKTKTALEVAASVLRYYENYTDIPYALTKLDLIGLPEFVSGALETYGLITFKETYILYSETESSLADLKQITSVISHELSHMWWGNLVSPSWWNALYLNEGFASYFEYKGQNAIQNVVSKRWNVFDFFITSDVQGAMRADSLKSARPIDSPVLTPDQITSIFDTFSYGKAASVLYVVENIIGQEAFQRCSRNYLKSHSFGVVTTDDMINAYKDEIKKATGIEGDVFLTKYLFVNSYAIVNVERVGKDSLKLSQSAYNTNSTTALEEPWNMQVDYLLTENRKGKFVLSQVSQTVKLNNEIAENEWFKLNTESTGYYIVSYVDNDWKLLIDQLKLKPTTFSVKDRANIIFDAGQLSDKDLLSYETLFSLFDYLKNENDYLPWSVASSLLSSIQAKLISTGSFSIPTFNSYTRDLLGTVYDQKVDLTADLSTMTYEQIALRNVLISLACRVESEKCISQASSLFRSWLDDGVKVDANIRSHVYKYGLKASSDDTDWKRVWDLYVAERDALEKSKLMSALTSTSSTTMLLTLISYSRNQSIINNENFFSVQQNIAGSSDLARGMIWDYIKNNWAELVERFGLNDRRLGNYVKSVTSGFGTEARLQEMEDFFSREPDAGAGASARLSALEAVKKNIQWSADSGEKIATSLSLRDKVDKPWLNWRLDEFVSPSHYDLSFDIDVDQEKFSGTVSIQVNVRKPIRYLILQAKDLTINSSKVFTQKEKTLVSDENCFEYKGHQFWVIPMKQIISSGQYIAELSFNGPISSSLNGLYLSRYNSTSGEQRKLATTQMEAGFARKVFPSFDEPSFKATFTISITHASKYNALSNMPVDYTRSSSEDKQTTVFKKSSKISTYLIAMVVSDFVSKKSPLSPDFSVYTYNPEINLPKVDLALNYGPRILDYFENYFQLSVAQLTPKFDLISIPDFSLGAMENVGLVTFRDVYILYDETESTSSSKMQVCSIIAHELAHSWYGNLVSLNWWSELWLNEGFAEFMMYKATAAVEPTWSYNDHFIIKELNRVFDIDTSLSTHPILTPVRDENDMQSIFDPVTYAKGASIIRMLENTIGEDNFRKAVSNYMKKYSYSNTVSTQLWAEFSDVVVASKLDVGAMMDTWISKEGIPVVTVSTNSDGTVSFKQERFLKDFDRSNSSYTWYIPLTYRVFDPKNADLDNPIGRIAFDRLTANATIAEYSADNVIKFNVDQTGVYILNYPTKNWNQFIDLLSDNSSLARQKLSVLDRNNLLSDAFYLSRSGRLSYDITLKLASAILNNEDSFIVWVTASDMLRFLRTFAITEDQGIAFNQWLLNNGVSRLYDQLGWEPAADENLNQRQLRALILDLACYADHEHCLQTANQKFAEFQTQVNGRVKRSAAYTPDPDLLNVFLFHTMRTVKSESDSKYSFLTAQYENAQSTNEKMRYLRALSAVSEPNLLAKLVNQSLDTEFLRPQDYFTFLAYIASNPVGLDIAWKSYRDNFETIQTRFGLDDSNLGRAVYRFASYFTSSARQTEVQQFFSKYPKAGASELYRQQATELISANLQWTKQFYSSVIEHVTSKCDSKICPWNVFRLNPKVSPDLYEITIQVNTDTFLYNGSVKAHISVDDPVQYIILHCASILIPSKPSVYAAGANGVKRDNTDLSTSTGFRYNPLEFYVIPLKRALTTGKYIVEVSFEGNLLLGGQVGLYRGFYEDNDNGTAKTVNLAATQFESTHARKMFPCLDEPHFKSPIDMTIIHEKSKNATLSNMKALKSEPYAPILGWMQTTYERSVKMVTYLIAILVSDFQCTSTTVSGSGSAAELIVSTCASKVHHLKKHEYSLEVTPEIIQHYEKFLNFKYQLDKVDQIAIPQFSAGAMENWGLVKYREKMLLWTEAEETSAEQRSVVAVIAHELAHMWFGNLVTTDFWGDLWLNEAFASYFEYSAVASVHPEWNYFDTLAYYDQFNAMLSDSSETSQQIVRDVSTPALMSYSSAIVYNKGSSILNMFNNTMGPEKFQLSLQKYLDVNQYTSVTTSYLFDQFASNWVYPEQNITEFMRSWTFQPGFPYLNITLNDDNTYTVTQERFLQNGARPKKDYLYVIPFSHYSFDAKTKKLQTSAVQFLTEKTTTISSQFSNSIKINPGFNNFYIVNYPESYWTELSERLLANKDDFINSLMVNDRAELLISSFLLSRAKLTNYLVPFRLYNYLVNEKHFVPWYYYDYTLSYLALRIDRTEYRESLMQFERRLTTPHYTGIDFWDDSVGHNLEKSFRMLLITITCRSGNKQCLEDAYKKFSDWKNSNADVKYLPPNLRGNILCYGIRASQSKSDYSFVWDQYKITKSDSPLKTVYLRALSFITDQDTLKSYIDLSLNESVMPVGDFITFFNYIIENFSHEMMAWNYFKENYSMLARKLTISQVNSILSRFATYSVTSDRKLEISTFLNGAPKLGSEAGRKSVLQSIDSNLAWMTTRKTQVGEWFTQNACGQTNPEPCPWGRLQIDKNEVLPVKYDLDIQVNVTTFIYNGTIDVTLTTQKDLDFVTLNAASLLSVDLVSITGPNKEPINGEMFRYKPQDYVVIRFNKAQPPAQYVLRFNFKGNMLDAGLSGLYLSNYSSNDLSTTTIGVTQFEFYDARKVMVSMDQPGFKTPFLVSITHDKKMNATLSNMDISSKTPVLGMPDWVQTKYKMSPPMPTYLVVLLISDFVCVQNTVDNIRFGICAAPPQQSKMDYALLIAPKTLEALENRTGVKIDQLEKIDLAAIPDFAFGAMEGEGLITFRETALLFSETETTSASKMGIASIVAHELAHFFFGNLVTCEWWDVLFLNEAFATFMTNYAVDKVEPTWEVHDMFLMNDYESAVQTDSVDTVHPILRPITTTKQIDQFTSSIVYSKGATVLRQTAFVMGVENFFKSINKYLEVNKDGNVREDDLFKQLDVNFPQYEGVNNATDYLQEWIKQKGFPYVNVSLDASGYKVVQKRFLLSPEGSTSTIWKVPLSYYINTSWTENKIKFLTKPEDIITGPPQNGLVKFNSGHNGLFLVNYSPDLWKTWIKALVENFAETNLPVADRAGFLLDSFYLAKANLLNYATPLKLAQYLKNEEHITPWTIAIRGINGIRNNVVLGSPYSAQFQEYIQNIVSPFYAKLGWNDADGNEVKRRLRATILDFACANNLKDCLSQSKILFKQWKDSKSSNNNANATKPNLLSTVLKYGIQDDASTENWQFLWSEYLKETSASLRSIYLSALANTQNQDSIKMLLNQALDTTAIRSQDVNLVLSAVANSKNTQSIETLWQFYKTNYKQLAGPTSPLRQVQLSSLLNSICANYFFTSDRKSELQSFFTQNPTLGLTNSQRTSAINTINSNIAWTQNRMKEVENFLQCGDEFCPFTNFRLNSQVYPETYDLFLNVDLENDQFSGSVKITTNITAQNLRYINVHAASTLNITSSKVIDSATKTELTVKRAFAYKPFSFWVVEFDQEVKQSTVELYFEFNSKLATDMAGFYLSEYYDPSTQKMVKLAATQFQATSARRCFPSFDEPSFKSVFNVKLKHKKEYISTMSNNKVLSKEENSDGTITTTFDKSPKMVTYLLAFVVSDFYCGKTTSSGGTNVQVCSSPPMKDMTSYALDISPRLLDTFGTKFNYNYSQMLPKIDILAIPDFSAGAMENWGLVTFRETALLWKETISSAYDQMRVASVVAHELAHMWTGNLVTCQWWSDLWINESFASFLEWFSVNILQPKWDYTQLFFVTDSIPALNADASLTSHPLVRILVNSPASIPYISAITYQKGSSILRMFEFVFGTDPFFNSIANYLNENQYTSVPSSVILDAFSTIPVDKLNSTQFVYDWTTQAGFPYINLTYANNGKTNSYVATQERFLSTGRITNNTQKWTIPLSYYTNYNTDNSKNIEFITKKTQNIVAQVTNADDPVKFNVDSKGFYIVLYPLEDWNKWIKLFQDASKITKLTSQDYSQLLYDSSVLAGAGHLPITIPLELTAVLKHKEDFSVWNTGSSIFSQFWPIFRTNETTGINALMQNTFKAYVQSLVSTVYNNYGLQSAEPGLFQEQRLRSEVSSFACAYGLDRCLLEAQVEYKKWRTQGSSISANIRATVLRYAIQESTDKSDWEYLWNVYTKTWQTSVKLDYLQALAQTSNKELLTLLFDRANDQSLVRRQDYLSLYSYVVRTQAGYEVAWNYFTTNYKTIRTNRLSDSQIGTVAGYFARYLKTKQQKADFQQFFIDHTDTGISTTNLNKALETIDKNIVWVNTYRKSVYDWFRTKNSQIL